MACEHKNVKVVGKSKRPVCHDCGCAYVDGEWVSITEKRSEYDSDVLPDDVCPAVPLGGCMLIMEERKRQVMKEGWTVQHDDQHTKGELRDAALGYLFRLNGKPTKNPPPIWPWDKKWWKPKDKIRDLVRAGALIAAEIDRLRRAQGEAQD